VTYGYPSPEHRRTAADTVGSESRKGLLTDLLHARNAMQADTTGLLARGLSAPPILRDELALQRSLDGQR
jgi:hypothetical protein